MEETETSEAGNEESSFDGLSGFALLQALQIPAQPLVYCDQLEGLVKVTDRTSPMGLCFNVDPQSGLSMTADELYVKEYVMFLWSVFSPFAYKACFALSDTDRNFVERHMRNTRYLY